MCELTLRHNCGKSTYTATSAQLPNTVTQYITRKTEKTGDVLKEQKAEALAALEKAKIDQRRGALTSPVEGVVLDRYESNERYVAAGTVSGVIGGAMPATGAVERPVTSSSSVATRESIIIAA